jgi:hypothetical protein
MHLRDLTQFLTELKDNNTRPWFLWNKPRYDILRAEFLETVTELIREISKFDGQVAACNPKKAVFRSSAIPASRTTRHHIKRTFQQASPRATSAVPARPAARPITSTSRPTAPCCSGPANTCRRRRA